MIDLFSTIQLLRFASNPGLIARSTEVSIPFRGTQLSAAWFKPDRPGPHPALLLSHGFTHGGSQEPRILQLASGLRQIGFQVLVPSFPEAEDLRVTPETLHQIVESFRFLSTLPDVDTKNRGIFGVSYGATLGLLAASHESIRDQVAWVVSLGGYASLEEVVHFGFTGRYPKDGPIFSIPPDPFIKEILEKNPEAPKWKDVLSIQEDISIANRTKIILIHSKTDPVVPWKEMEKLESIFRLKGLNVKSYLIQLDGHARITSVFTGLQTFLAARAIVKLK